MRPIASFRSWTYCRIVRSHTRHSGNSRRIRSQIRCAVCRCFRGAFLSASRIRSTNSIATAIFQRGRFVFLRRFGIALPMPHAPCGDEPSASWRLRRSSRCRTHTPCGSVQTVPPFCSNPTSSSERGSCPIQSNRSFRGWAKLNCRTGPLQSSSANWVQDQGPDGEKGRTLARSKAKPARPYICRLRNFRRLTWPSTWPLLQGLSTAAITAFESLRRPCAKRASGTCADDAT